MILYYSRTACSIAPHIALEEIGAEFEARHIDLAKGEHRSPDYLKVNPRGRVPAMVIHGEVVTEVPALLTYIAGLKPEAALIPPPGTLAHARCFEWLGFLSSTVHVTYAQFRRPERFIEPGSACAGEVSSEGLARTIALYEEVEERLRGPWAAGDAYSIADAYLFPFYTWAWRLELDMTARCPRWTDLFERTKKRPAVQRAMAREQGDI
jgi:glutathione S-transferase